MNPEVIESMIAAGRDSYEARLAAGQARLNRGELAQARAHLKQATIFKPEQTMAWQRGIAVAAANGDMQAENVMGVWRKRLDKAG